jgi:NAD+ synthase (glutamine-hydrolysing)
MANWATFGFSRVTSILPDIKLGQPLHNAQEFIRAFSEHAKSGSSILVTPELALTGYTCEDLFHSETLIQENEEGLIQILKASHAIPAMLVVGAPLRLMDGRLLNCAWVFLNGKVLGVIPKASLPNMGEFYERRWFVSGRKVHEKISHPKLGEFLVSPLQIFAEGNVRVGIEICQDLWTPNIPSEYLALKGANLILNLSASNEVVGKAAYRRKIVEVQSHKLQCAYFYVSAGNYESSKDTVFSGHAIAYELGELVEEQEPFHANAFFTVDFDFEKILNSRSRDICFLETVEDAAPFPGIIHSITNPQKPISDLKRRLETFPFLAEIPDYEDVIAIQANGLLRRLKSAHAKTMVIGISGGLDSTHALAVALRTRALSANQFKIVGVTMPGPGTSEKTLSISKTLLEESGVDKVIVIPIGEAVSEHLKSLGKVESDRGVVYENAQARERTQILFDLANEHQGVLIGTGDLSELALGWCTFNGDQMAHYAVNSGIPKTVVKGLVSYWASIAASRILKATLEKIVALPISPELLPPAADGSIHQETEALIGSFDLHDFFLYYFLNFGFSKEKIHALAIAAFSANDNSENRALLSELDRTIDIFFKRFFPQQFKRSTLPPGPKVHQVSLSPRSDFRMPDEIAAR